MTAARRTLPVSTVLAASITAGCAHDFGPYSEREATLIERYGEPDIIVEFATVSVPMKLSGDREFESPFIGFASWDDYVDAYDRWPGGMLSALPAPQSMPTFAVPLGDADKASAWSATNAVRSDFLSPFHFGTLVVPHSSTEWWYRDDARIIRLRPTGDAIVLEHAVRYFPDELDEILERGSSLDGILIEEGLR